jgi:hypothetical protein
LPIARHKHVLPPLPLTQQLQQQQQLMATCPALRRSQPHSRLSTTLQQGFMAGVPSFSSMVGQPWLHGYTGSSQQCGSQARFPSAGNEPSWLPCIRRVTQHCQTTTGASHCWMSAARCL